MTRVHPLHLLLIGLKEVLTGPNMTCSRSMAHGTPWTMFHGRTGSSTLAAGGEELQFEDGVSSGVAVETAGGGERVPVISRAPLSLRSRPTVYVITVTRTDGVLVPASPPSRRRS